MMATEGGDMMNYREKIKQEFIEVPITGEVFRIIEGMDKLRNANVDELTRSLVYVFENQDRIALTNAEEMKNALSASQIQLFIYLLYRWREHGGEASFHVELKDYYRYKGIKIRNDSKKRFERDLAVLSAITIQIATKNTGYIYGPLLQFKKENVDYYEIQFDTWIEHLNPSRYTLLHKHFFKLQPHYHRDAILLTLKISQIYKLQLRKPNFQPNIKFNTLCKLLDIPTETIKKQGFKSMLKRFRCIAGMLEQNFGFIIEMKCETDSLTQFYDNKLYYEQPILKKHYQSMQQKCQ